MRQQKKTVGLWSAPPCEGPSNVTQGTANPSPEEVERRTLPTQGNQFPHQTKPPHGDDEAVALAIYGGD